MFPKSAKLVYPGIDLLKRIRVNRIDSSWPFDSNSDEAAFAQCPEMLRNARLRNAKLFLDDVRDTSGAAFATGEEFENPAPHRIAENIKSMHGRSMQFSSGQYRKRWFALPPLEPPLARNVEQLCSSLTHRLDEPARDLGARC